MTNIIRSADEGLYTTTMAMFVSSDCVQPAAKPKNKKISFFMLCANGHFDRIAFQFIFMAYGVDTKQCLSLVILISSQDVSVTCQETSGDK